LLPYWERAIVVPVRIVAYRTFREFVARRVEPKHRQVVAAHLDAWYAQTAVASWKNSAEVKMQYRSASIVSSDRIVFNIRGNAYRLVVKVDYHYGVVLILWLGSHAEYDRIDVQTVEYERGRYADSPDRQ